MAKGENFAAVVSVFRYDGTMKQDVQFHTRKSLARAMRKLLTQVEHGNTPRSVQKFVVSVTR